MAIESPGLARLLGQVGVRARWAKYPPGSPQRAEQTARARAGIRRRWIAEAEAQAAAKGLTLTPAQIEQSATDLYLASMAARRLKAYQTLLARYGEATESSK